MVDGEAEVRREEREVERRGERGDAEGAEGSVLAAALFIYRHNTQPNQPQAAAKRTLSIMDR
jgi:hypothetical protein